MPKNYSFYYKIKTQVQKHTFFTIFVIFQPIGTNSVLPIFNGPKIYLAKNKSSKFTLLKHAYSTRLKSSKHAKMSAITK